MCTNYVNKGIFNNSVIVVMIKFVDHAETFNTNIDNDLHTHLKYFVKFN